jgi:hypothetical protein
MLKVHVVGAPEVIKDRNPLLCAGLAVLPLEGIVLGVGTFFGILRLFFEDELLDRVDFVIFMNRVSQCHKLQKEKNLPSFLPRCLTRNFNLTIRRKSLKSSDIVKPPLPSEIGLTWSRKTV